MTTSTSDLSDEAPASPLHYDDQPDDPNSIDVREALVELYRENARLLRERADRIVALNETYAETLTLKNEVIASLRRRLAIYEPEAATPRPS